MFFKSLFNDQAKLGNMFYIRTEVSEEKTVALLSHLEYWSCGLLSCNGSHSPFNNGRVCY